MNGNGLFMKILIPVLIAAIIGIGGFLLKLNKEVITRPELREYLQEASPFARAEPLMTRRLIQLETNLAELVKITDTLRTNQVEIKASQDGLREMQAILKTNQESILKELRLRPQ